MIKTLALALTAALFAAQAAGAAGAAVVELGPKANGTTVRVHVGDRLVLRLPANASTGYSWSLTARGAPTLHLDSARYVAPAKPGLVGAPGAFVARFTAGAAGRARLTLVYIRHTRPATPPGSRFAATVVVSPK